MEHDPLDRPIRDALQRAAAAQEGCISVEVAAAWADRALDRRERARIEAHAAGCARCQSLLAMMIRSAEPALPGESRGRGRLLGWLVPVAVAAAAVVFWIRVPGRPTAEPPRTAAVETAAERTPPAAQPAPTTAPSDNLTARVEGRQSFGGQQKPAPEEPRRERSLYDEELKRSAEAPNETRRADAASAAAAPSVDAKARLADRGWIIASSDPRTVWRSVPGSIQRSTDGGQTWQVQAQDAPALTGGAAPTASVCWMVGPRGVVMLADDGVSWRRLPFPDRAIDLVAIQAADARSAVVTASDGRQFRTSDAGATWTPAPPQDFPAAPF
jgi:hypothetical protein